MLSEVVLCELKVRDEEDERDASVEVAVVVLSRVPSGDTVTPSEVALPWDELFPFVLDDPVELVEVV